MPAVPIHEQKFIVEVSGCPEKLITNSHVLSKPETAKQVLFLRTKKSLKGPAWGSGTLFAVSIFGIHPRLSSHKMNVYWVGGNSSGHPDLNYTSLILYQELISLTPLLKQDECNQKGKSSA